MTIHNKENWTYYSSISHQGSSMYTVSEEFLSDYTARSSVPILSRKETCILPTCYAPFILSPSILDCRHDFSFWACANIAALRSRSRCGSSDGTWSVVSLAKVPHIWLLLKQPHFFSSTEAFRGKSLFYFSTKSWYVWRSSSDGPVLWRRSTDARLPDGTQGILKRTKRLRKSGIFVFLCVQYLLKCLNPIANTRKKEKENSLGFSLNNAHHH